MIARRTWFRVHSFTGVITGLLLFVICWSGTFAVIAHELDWLVTPEARLAEPGPAGVDWQRVQDSVAAAFPDAEVSWLEAPLYRRSAAQVVIDLPHQSSVRVYVHPGTGEVLGHSSYFTVQRFFRSFHANLFIPGYVGSYIVMALAVTLLMSLVAALWFYRRWWRRFFQVPRWSAGREAFWSELHKAGGLWSLWFILVIAVTGLWYLFEMGRGHFGDGIIAYAGNGTYAKHQIDAPPSLPDARPLPLRALVTVAAARRPDLEIRSISFDRDAAGRSHEVYFDGQSDHWLVRDRANQLRLDARTGAVLHDQHADRYPLYWRWSDTADPLHFGDFGGLVTKVVWFVFGLVLCGLVLTGTWLHARRLVRQGGYRRHHWPGTAAATAASLVVVAAAVPYGFVEAREYYGVTDAGVRRLPVLLPGVLLVIAGWVAMTLAILVGWLVLLRQVQPAAELERAPAVP